MARVKLNHSQPKEIATRRQLLEILAPEVKVTRLIPTWDGVIVLTASEKDADIIFDEGKQKRLKSAGFSALMPPELKSLRTVICTRLDDIIYENQPQGIQEELERKQTWADVREIYKFPRSNTIKVTFATSGMAKKARDGGLLMFSMSVAATQIHEELYIPLMSCNRCYAVEEHPTSQCPEPTTYKACSECSSEEHTYRDCTSTEKKCLNCGLNHSARAMRCQVRKKALREKEEELKRGRLLRNSTTYAQATSNVSSGADTAAFNMAGLMCVMHAHMVESAVPGSFQRTLSESLALNGLKDVKLPPNPPSRDIIRAITGGMGAVPTIQDTPHNPHTAVEDTHEPPSPSAPDPPDSAEDSAEEGDVAEEESEEDDHQETENEQKNRIGVSLIKKNSDVWPESCSYKSIVKGIKKGRIKVGHNGDVNDTSGIVEMLRTTQSPLSKFYVTVEDSTFSTIKNGPLPKGTLPVPMYIDRQTRQT